MITLREVDRENPDPVLYELMSEKTADNSISHATMPTLEQHRSFVKSHPFRAWYTIEAEEGSIGAISANDRNELRIGVLTRYRTDEVIGEAIEAIATILEPLPAKASECVSAYAVNINPQDCAMRAALLKIGAVHVQDTYKISQKDQP